MKILVYSPIKQDATSYYRSWGAFRRIEKSTAIEFIDVNIEGREITWDMMLQADIFFCQRPSTPLDVSMMEVARSCGVPIWIDYDDDYLNIPVENPRYELYANASRREAIKRAIEYADVISVSTPAIKDSIIEKLGTPAEKFHIISNAYDSTMFELSIPADLNERNVVLWRGGDTHDHDVAGYLDVMVELYNAHPTYYWVFFGHVNQEFLKRVDSSRVILYPWNDVMSYFARLIEIKPKVVIVPWVKDKFNASKSNCSFLEGCMAGALTVFPSWHSEAVTGMVLYDDPASFHSLTEAVLLAPDLTESLRLAQRTAQDQFALPKVNRLRLRAMNSLTEKTKHFQPLTVLPQVYTDEQFFNYTHEKQLNQDYDGYKKGHFSIAAKLLEHTKADKIIELGCGPGPMLEYFCDVRVPEVVGFDTNKYFKEYFDKRNPYYRDCFICHSFLNITIEGVYDLAISIECFEHIPMDVLMPFIQKLASHCKFFYFSSTPYRSTVEFDHVWGHVNVQTHERWIEIFEANGFKKVSNPQWITQWDLLFESTRVTSSQPDALLLPSDSQQQFVTEPAPESLQPAPVIES